MSIVIKYFLFDETLDQMKQYAWLDIIRNWPSVVGYGMRPTLYRPTPVFSSLIKSALEATIENIFENPDLVPHGRLAGTIDIFICLWLGPIIKSDA